MKKNYKIKTSAKLKTVLLVSTAIITFSCKKQVESTHLEVNTMSSVHENEDIEFNTSASNNGLVAYYPFNGNANDESGNKNNGIVKGATLTTDRFGRKASAYSFNGTTSLISMPSPFYNGERVSKLTFSCSFYLNVLPSANNPFTIYHKNGFWQGLGIAIHNDGSLELGGSIPIYQYQFVNSNPNIVQAKKWYTLVITYDNNISHMFLNGMQLNTSMITMSQGGTILTNNVAGFIDFGEYVAGNSNATNYFGAANSVSTGDVYFMNGKLDDFRFYNRVLTNNEIKGLSGSEED